MECDKSKMICTPAGGGSSYCHQPNFVEIGLVDKRPFFLRFARIFRTFLPGRIAGKILLGKTVQKMRLLHLQKINKVHIYALVCFVSFSIFILTHIHVLIYMCINKLVFKISISLNNSAW